MPRVRPPLPPFDRVASAIRLTGCIVAIETGEMIRPYLGQTDEVTLIVARHEMLDREFLASVQPDYVVIPLVGASHDVLEVAEALVAAEYAGVLVALSPALPNRRLIKSEVRAHCPRLRFEIIENTTLH